VCVCVFIYITMIHMCVLADVSGHEERGIYGQVLQCEIYGHDVRSWLSEMCLALASILLQRVHVFFMFVLIHYEFLFVVSLCLCAKSCLE
jgi:hypothetical protein